MAVELSASLAKSEGLEELYSTLAKFTPGELAEMVISLYVKLKGVEAVLGMEEWTFPNGTGLLPEEEETESAA